MNIRDILLMKHPPGNKADPSAVVGPSKIADDPFYPIIFERITGLLIKSVAKNLYGATSASWLMQ